MPGLPYSSRTARNETETSVIRSAARLVLATALAGSFLTIAAPAASANDCSNPKTPCGGCSLNLQATDVRDLVVCHPV